MSDDSLLIFSEEAGDLLGSAEQALLNLDNFDDEPATQEGVDDLFRTFHTIKGAAGLFGLDNIVSFTHIVENILGKIRERLLDIDEELVSLFLLSRDHLELLVNSALSGEENLSGELEKADGELKQKLTAYMDTPASPELASQAPPVEQAQDDSGEGVANKNWHISLRFGPNALRYGMDPASFIGYLRKIGDLNSVTLIDDALPNWSDYDPENCYLGFEISLLAPGATKEILEEVFEFVQDDCKISILPPNSHIDAYVKMIEKLPEQDMRIGEILLACGALTEREIDDVLNTQDHISDEFTVDGEASTVPPIGKIAVSQQVVRQEVVDAAVKKQHDLKLQNASAKQTIRVNALKLENLVNLVGELVIGSASTELNAQRLADPELNEAMENLLRLVEDVRDTTLGLRMVQIGETFNRFKRVVREVSRDTGKNIELVINGADTELDKTLIETISDPLMHLVRNAIDHGIESPQKREAAGKPAKGVVKLEAFHDSGSIVIQISDDGGGLSKEKILKKALEKGIIREDQQLSERETYQLIFEAGFSTAETVSNLSGRGVGMDVVRRNIESIRGHVEIESSEGKGCTIVIRLPLTLAIIDGFQVRVGDAHYILPLDMVDECIELNETLRGKDENADYLSLRGEILPFMYLTDVFGTSQSTNGNSMEKNRDNIVVVKFAGKKAGFVVDQLLGEQQTVIKPLGKVFGNLKGISGATILGSGEVALIIDIPVMLKRAINSSRTELSSPSIDSVKVA